MPTMPPVFRSHRRPDPDQARRESDRRRGSARARGYDGKWDREAAAYRDRNPLCLYCEIGAFGEEPRVSASECVDHLIPHRGDRKLFWDRKNWVASCRTCHDGPKQAVEHRPADLQALANAVRTRRGA